ncbi:molecular chaperone HtpG [Kordiimonas lacus]|uniref:Molecular chaperone HtpG n=3 Tax=Kordiimonas lacus TaxID=637679 RepID=A0A1G7AF49_9PROT|nr:molecular chaperone HtpG [Kordiimonas lacus]
MTNAGLMQTSVDLDGLLEVLGKNLYSTPSVALRELIQNASDACERHRIESGAVREYRIDIRCDAAANQLVIQDNGSGLARGEVESFLATIGSGYSRLLRQQTQSEDIIGYFGLGFLSAYVVSHKVEVLTTSYQTPDQSWKFSSAKGKTYSVSPASRQPEGTTVILSLDDEFTSLADHAVITSLIKRYCCLLPIPIHLNDSPAPVNDLTAPWLLEGEVPLVRRRRAELAFAQTFENAFEPIACIAIPEDNDLGLAGLIWIQDGGTYGTSDNRNISIFIRNMFITREDRDLLPRWAGFCGALLESAQFKPTASRESLQRNAYYDAVASYVREVLASGLRRIVLEEPETWRRIQARHNDALLGAAISDDRLFETTYRSLKVPTTEGDLTVQQIMSKGDGAIYIKPGEKSGHDALLFRVRGNPLVKGYLYGATAFCKKYSDIHNIKLLELGSRQSQGDVFPTVPPAEAACLNPVRHLFESDKHDVVFTRFEPSFIPLVIMEDADVVTKNRIESDQADKRISSAVLGLARLHTSATASTKERTVFLNLENGILQQLPDLDETLQDSVGQMLGSLMELLCLDTGQADTGLDQLFKRFDTALSALLPS